MGKNECKLGRVKKEVKVLKIKKKESSWVWWYTPLIPTLKRQRQTEICEFKVWWHVPLILTLGRQSR